MPRKNSAATTPMTRPVEATETETASAPERAGLTVQDLGRLGHRRPDCEAAAQVFVREGMREPRRRFAQVWELPNDLIVIRLGVNPF